MSDKTYAYIPTEFADRIKAAENDSTLQEQVINNIIQRQKDTYKAEIEYLEEATLAFKQFCVTHRNRLAEVYDDEADKLEKLIDAVSNNHQKVKDSAGKLAQQIAPLKQEVQGIVLSVEELDKRLAHINTYRLKDTLDIIERIATLDEKSQNILLKVLGEK